MSHSHRDDQDLVDAGIQDTVTASVTPAQPALTNSEAARRAAERRNAEGADVATTEHQFTGDLPEPSRGDEDNGGARRNDDDIADEAAAVIARSSPALRGPPPPIALQHEDDTTWAAPPRIEAHGAAFHHADTRWTAAREEPDRTFATKDESRWAK